MDQPDGQNEVDIIKHIVPIHSEKVGKGDGCTPSGSESTSSLEKTKGFKQRKAGTGKSLLPHQSRNELTAGGFFFTCEELRRNHHLYEDSGSPCLFGIVCLAASQSFLLLNLRSSQHIHVFLRFFERTSVRHAIDDALFLAFCQFCPQNFTIKIYGLVRRPINKDNILRASALICLGDLYWDSRLRRLEMSVARIKGAHSISFLSTSSQKVDKKKECDMNWKTRSMSTGEGFGSCTDVESTCTYHSKSFEPAVIFSKGLLRVLWKEGVPYFTFSIVDGEDYIAIRQEVPTKANGPPDYVYLFHTIVSSGMGKYDDNVHGLLGLMKVSSQVTSNSGLTKSRQTEFVLYDSTKNYTIQKQNLNSNARKKRGVPKLVRSAIRKDLMNRKKTNQKSCECSPTDPLAVRYEQSSNALKKLWENDCAVILKSVLQPNLELVAVIIRDCHCDEQKMNTGGWGLKFLRKCADAKTKLSAYLSVPLESCFASGRGSASRIDALIPSGFHSFPENGAKPSGLIERWRSGRCDCGGWDLGCPFSLLRSRAATELGLPEEATKEDSSTINLVKEGHTTSEPSMRIEALHENLYLVHFQSNLSVIQSFSIGLSLIHQQIASSSPDS